MKIAQVLIAAAFVAAGAVSARADEPGPDVIVKRTHVRQDVRREVRRHIAIRTVSVQRGERDGAVLLSGKVMSREYAYPRYSPGLLPTSVAVAYGYAYAPDYGFAYRLVPPVPAGANASSSRTSSIIRKACLSGMERATAVTDSGRSQS